MNCCSSCSVDPRLLMLEKVVDSLIDVGMLVMRKGVEVELISTVTGFKSVARASVDPEDNCVESAVGNI